MLSDQQRARVFGVLYLITFVTSIPALLLYQPVLDDPVGYITGGGQNNQIAFGVLLELLLIIANIGTAVVIYPIVRRQSVELALGYVTARLFECAFILVGIVAVLGIVTLQQDVAGPAEGTLAYTLAGIKDWTFLLGPGWVVGWGNGLILGYLMYKLQVGPRTAKDDLVRSRRRAARHPHGHPRLVRRHERWWSPEGHRDDPRGTLGTLPRHLLHGEGVQALFSNSPTRRGWRSHGGDACSNTCLERDPIVRSHGGRRRMPGLTVSRRQRTQSWSSSTDGAAYVFAW
jgi:Domain of unknown function (DUF4386)